MEEREQRSQDDVLDDVKHKDTNRIIQNSHSFLRNQSNKNWKTRKKTIRNRKNDMNKRRVTQSISDTKIDTNLALG